MQPASIRRNKLRHCIQRGCEHAYLSSLERGLKSPTMAKVEQLASVLEIHPLSLLALAYIPRNTNDVDALFAQITADIRLMSDGQA